MAINTGRRKFISALGGAAVWPRAARAQLGARTPVIGVLSPFKPGDRYAEAFRIGLQELGYVDGQNIRYEFRWASSNFDQLPDLAADLVRMKVDVIVAFVTAASLAARRATETIPIVMVYVSDPVGTGLIKSLARPGGDITGTAGVTAVLFSKQLELLRDVTLNVTRFAVLSNPANLVFQKQQIQDVTAAAGKLGVELQLLEARTPLEFDAIFGTIDKQRTKALLIMGDPLFSDHIQELAELSIKNRLIAIYSDRAFVVAGGFMAYGPDISAISKYTAVFVDKILKGAKPSDLPVEEPTLFRFIVNLKTAKTLGIDVPTSILLRADEVIE
jgi:putative tryptophan/tyrosine transport system substrate-binding protein